MRDYYEILGVTRTIDEAGLKSAFRKLAMEHHPDRNGGCENATGRFKEINEAYSVLSDPQKRAAYDRFGHAGVNGGGAGASAASKASTPATSSTMSSATCSARCSAAAVASRTAPSAARTCATTWRSPSSRPMPAPRSRSRCPPP
ncbi:DnaJ domain-containing protein [Caulobacter segnis]